MFERKGTKVLIPSEAQLAIIKGAVLFGYQPAEISKRILKVSYGYDILPVFVEGYHDSSRKFLHTDGKHYCIGVLRHIASKGTEVAEGDEFISQCESIVNEDIELGIYVSDEPEGLKPKYTDETNVKSIDLNTGEEAVTVIDFLP